jgi:hypothetical protein
MPTLVRRDGFRRPNACPDKEDEREKGDGLKEGAAEGDPEEPGTKEYKRLAPRSKHSSRIQEKVKTQAIRLRGEGGRSVASRKHPEGDPHNDLNHATHEHEMGMGASQTQEGGQGWNMIAEIHQQPEDYRDDEIHKRSFEHQAQIEKFQLTSRRTRGAYYPYQGFTRGRPVNLIRDLPFA